jgi:hypothetical protein
MTFCPFCGTKIQPGAARCSKCNEALSTPSDPRGSTLMGVSTVKSEDLPDPNAPQLSGFVGSSVLVDQGISKTSTPKKLPSVTDSNESPTMPSPRSGETKPPQSSWGSDLNASGVGMMPANDSLMLRAGDIVDPVTGLPLRAFRAKPKSRVPLAVAGALLLSFVGLMYYISRRPAPLIVLSVADQVASGDSDKYQLTVETTGSKAEAIKIKGVEAKPEENKAKVELPDDAIPVGKSRLPIEIKVAGEWKQAAPLTIIRPARVKVTLDKPNEVLKFDFEVMEGGTEVTVFTSKAKVEAGKAHLEMSFRAASSPADQGVAQINKEAVYQIAGIEGDFSFTFSFPAPKPPFVLKGPEDYLSITDKKIDKQPLDFEAAPDMKVTVTVNQTPVTSEDGKFTVPLKPEENIIVIKAEGKDVAPIEITRHIWRGVAPAGWNKNETKIPTPKTP